MNCRRLFLSVVVLVAVVDERSAQNHNNEERINYVQWYNRRLRLAREQLSWCSTCLMPLPPLLLAEQAYKTLPRMSDRQIHSMVKDLTYRDCHSEPYCDFNILSKIGENSSPKLISYPESVRMGELQKSHAGFGRTVTWRTPKCVDPDNGDYVKINSDDEESGSFFSEGNHKIHYTANDFRGGTASLYIEFDVTVIECRADMCVQHGHNSCRNKRVMFGDRCSIHCDRGYRLIGSATLKCGKNAEFSSEKPVCELIECRANMHVQHGHNSCRNKRVTFGDRCSIHCDRGYRLIGSATLKCETNAEFSSEKPVCEPIECPDLQLPVGGLYYNCTGGSLFDSRCFLLCNRIAGYTLNRTEADEWRFYPGATLCLENGTWSTEPTCRAEQQPVGLTIFVFMTISTNCTANENFSKAVRKFILESDGIMAFCPQCRIGDVKSRCFVRGGRETAKVRVTLLNDIGEKPISVYQLQLISVAKGMEDELEGRNLPEILSKVTHFRKSSLMLVCPDGFLPSGTACAGCPPGTMFQPHNSNCSLCPEGFYQDKVGQSTCEQCPPGTSTLSPGANNKNNCRNIPSEVQITKEKSEVTENVKQKQSSYKDMDENLEFRRIEHLAKMKNYKRELEIMETEHNLKMELLRMKTENEKIKQN